MQEQDLADALGRHCRARDHDRHERRHHHRHEDLQQVGEERREGADLHLALADPVAALAAVHDALAAVKGGGSVDLVGQLAMVVNLLPTSVLTSFAKDAAATVDDPVVAWLRAVHPTTTWTTSVCTGSIFLALAGILDGDGLDTVVGERAQEQLKSLGIPGAYDRMARVGGRATNSSKIGREYLAQCWVAVRVGIAEQLDWRISTGAA